jgi:hypothetical protein
MLSRSASTDAGAFNFPNEDSWELGLGKLDGYALDLSLRPTEQSRIELWREQGYLTYLFDGGVRNEESLVSSRIRYLQYFDNCVKFQGTYRSNPNSDHMELSFGRWSWNINVSRVQEGDSSDTSLRIGYALPLDGKHNARDCGFNSRSLKPMDPIVDITTRRPRQFPSEPLAIIETPVKSEPTTE